MGSKVDVNIEDKNVFISKPGLFTKLHRCINRIVKCTYDVSIAEL